jgi:COMM domain
MSDDHRDAVLHFWKGNSSKIHKELVAKSHWNASLQNVAWRIDLQTNSRNQSDVNEPSAIVQLHLKESATSNASNTNNTNNNNNNTQQQTDTVQFEMDRTQVSDFLHHLDRIDKVIADHS